MQKIHWNSRLISMECEGEYHTRIEQVVNYVIETELPQICKVEIANVRKIQALVALICSEVPFALNANKIAGALEIGRDTVVEYIKFLGDAKILIKPHLPGYVCRKDYRSYMQFFQKRLQGVDFLRPYPPIIHRPAVAPPQGASIPLLFLQEIRLGKVHDLIVITIILPHREALCLQNAH